MLIAQRSRTPIPQALSYLIDDLARRHGALRAGTASAYLRCDDEALLARVVERPRRRRAAVAADRADRRGRRRAGRPGARGAARGRVTPQPPRRPTAAGHRPRGGAAARARRGRRCARPTPAAPPTAARLGELVQRVRSGDALTELSRAGAADRRAGAGRHVGRDDGTAARRDPREQRVLLGVAEPGRPRHPAHDPADLDGRRLRARARVGPGRAASFPLHRITAVDLLDDEFDDSRPELRSLLRADSGGPMSGDGR